MQWVTALYGVLGLAVGSFLNVCIYRLPRRESIVLPRSHCPHCGKVIAAYDNVPLLAYLWLRGKCRSCRGSISLRYPCVELLTGFAFLACAREWAFEGPTFVNSLFLAGTIVLIFVDYDHQILPNVITLPGALAGIALSPFQSSRFYADSLSMGIAAVLPGAPAFDSLPWAGSVLGAVIGAGVLFLVASLYQLVRGHQGLGMGDIKMMAMVGAFLGWRMALLVVFLGSLLGSVTGIFLVLFHGRTLQTKLAFGTFLGAASAIVLFHGLDLLQWYAGTLNRMP